jgi:hypothetical protein
MSGWQALRTYRQPRSVRVVAGICACLFVSAVVLTVLHRSEWTPWPWLIVALCTLVLWGFGTIYLFATMRTRIELCAEGLVIARPFRSRRVPWSEVTALEIASAVDGDGVTLHRLAVRLADGQLVSTSLTSSLRRDIDRLLAEIDADRRTLVIDGR